MSKRKISWDKEAVTYFKQTIRYIRKDSSQNAEKVKNDILKSIKGLAQRPEIHSPDKFKTNNNGDYRAFELHRLRIVISSKKMKLLLHESGIQARSL
jgi:plasmid stabilization system protein ParE